MKIIKALMLVFGLLLIISNPNGLSAQTQSTEQIDSTYSEEDCYISGVKTSLRCYSIERPLYEGSDEATLLKGVIVPSRAAAPEKDPLVIIAGGPGQAASDTVAMLRSSFSGIRSVRDIIFFDIRGTGMSAPIVCDVEDDEIDPLTYSPIEETITRMGECYNENSAVLSSFSTKTAVEDLEHLRQAMGLDQINLWGGSYGTRLVQYYLYLYPENARSAILDSVVPFTPSYIALQPRHGKDVLEKLTNDCAADDICSSVYKDFDPIKLLNQIGAEQNINYTHPVTGELVNTTTSRDTVAQIIFSAIYSPSGRSFVPYALTQAVLKNNWAPMSVLSTQIDKYMGQRSIYMATHLSITCAEESAAINTDATLDDQFFNGSTLTMFKALCQFWPVAKQALPRPEQNQITVPTVMISGSYDPITPPQLAEHALGSFQNARHIVIENGGHINSTTLCVKSFITKFIKTPNDPELEPKCEDGSYVPEFVVGPNANVQLGDGK